MRRRRNWHNSNSTLTVIGSHVFGSNNKDSPVTTCILLPLDSTSRKTQEINTEDHISMRMRPMHSANHGVSYTWGLTTFLEVKPGWRVDQRKACWAVSVGMFATFETTMAILNSLWLCAVMMLSNHTSSVPTLTGGCLRNYLRECHCKGPLEAPAFHCPCGVWIFRILWRTCFSAAYMHAGQPWPVN